MVINIIPVLYFAVIFSTSMLFSNLTVLEHFPTVNSDAITFASATSSDSSSSSAFNIPASFNSSTNGLNVAVITMSLSPASISTSSLSRPGTATFK